MDVHERTFSSPVADALRALPPDGVDAAQRLQQLLRTAEILTKWLGLLAIPWDSPEMLSDDQRGVLRRALESGSFGDWEQACRALGRERLAQEQQANPSRVDFRAAAATWSERVLAPIAGPSLPAAMHVIQLRNQFQHGWGSQEVDDAVLRELHRRILDQLEEVPTLTEQIIVEQDIPRDPVTEEWDSDLVHVRTAESRVPLFPVALLASTEEDEANSHSLIVISRYRASGKSAAEYLFTHRFGVKLVHDPKAVNSLGALLPPKRRRHPLIDLDAEVLAGRDGAIRTALDAVRGAKQGSVLMLEAEPGAGKSALLARLSQELFESTADDADTEVYGTYFSSSRYFERSRQTRTDPRHVLADIDGLVNRGEWEDEELDKIVRIIVSRCSSRRDQQKSTILLVDGLDEIETEIGKAEREHGKEAEFLDALREIAGAGATVVASRRIGTGTELTGANEHLLLREPLRRLTVEESVHVLDERLGERAIHHEPETLAEVARRSEGLPLFLEMAAKHLRRNDWTTAQPQIETSLEGYFKALRTASVEATTSEVTDQLLALLAYSGAGVPGQVLEQAVHDGANSPSVSPHRQTVRALDWLSPLLTEDVTGGYRLFHATVGNYLRAPSSSARESLANRADKWIGSLHRWVHDESVSAVCREFALLHGGRLLLERQQRARERLGDADDSDGSLRAVIKWVTDEELAEMQRASGPTPALQGLLTIQHTLETASERLELKDSTLLALLRTRRQALAADEIDPLHLLRESLVDGIVPDVDELLEVVPSEQRGLMHLALLLELALNRRRGLDVDANVFVDPPRASARWRPNEAVLRLALASIAPECGISGLTDTDLHEEIELFAELVRLRRDALDTVLVEKDVALAKALLSLMPPSASEERRLLAGRILADEDPARASDALRRHTLVLRAVAGDDAAEADVLRFLLIGENKTELVGIVGSCLRFGLIGPLEAALSDAVARTHIRSAILERGHELRTWKLLRGGWGTRNVCKAIEHGVLGPRNQKRIGGSSTRRVSPKQLRLLGLAARASRDRKLLARIVEQCGTGGTLQFRDAKQDKPRYAEAWLELGLAGHECGDQDLLELALDRLREIAKSLNFPRNKREILEKRASLLAHARRTDEARAEFRHAMDLALDSRLDNEVAHFSSAVLTHIAASDANLLPDVTTMLLRSRRESSVAYERARLHLEAALERVGDGPISITRARIRSKLLDRDKIRLDADARVLKRGATHGLGHVLFQDTYSVLFDSRVAHVAGSFSLDELFAMVDALAPRGEDQRAALSTLRAMEAPDGARLLESLYRKGEGTGKLKGYANAAPWLARGLPQLLWVFEVDWMSDTSPLTVWWNFGRFDRQGLWYVPAIVHRPAWATTEDFVTVLIHGTRFSHSLPIAIPVALLAASLGDGPGATLAGRALEGLRLEDLGGGRLGISLLDLQVVGQGDPAPMQDAESVVAVARGLDTPWNRPDARLVKAMYAICSPNGDGGRSDSISGFGECDSKDLVRLEVIAAALRDPLRFAREAFRVLEPSPACDVVAGILASIAGLLPPERRHIDDVLDFITEQEKALGPEDVAVIRLATLYYSHGSDRFLPTARDATSALRQAGAAAVRLAGGDEELLRRLAPLCSTRAEHAYALVEETVIVEPAAARNLAEEFARNVAPEGGTFGRR